MGSWSVGMDHLPDIALPSCPWKRKKPHFWGFLAVRTGLERPFFHPSRNRLKAVLLLGKPLSVGVKRGKANIG